MSDLKQNAALSMDDLDKVVGGVGGDVPCFVYIIQPGDCLPVLAQRYGTTVSILCQINNISNPNIIYAYNKLLIPYPS